MMKKLTCLLIALAMLFSHSACSNQTKGKNSTSQQSGLREENWKVKQLKHLSVPRLQHGMVALNGKIYIIGGMTTDTNGETKMLDTVEEYDPTTGKWTPKASMPSAKTSFGIACVGGKIYIMGGADQDERPLNTVEEYDPVKNKWTKKSPMPTCRMDLAAVNLNGRIYAIGGHRGYENITEVYDTAIDKWEEKAPTATSMRNPCVAVVNGIIYTVHGMIVERYSKEKDKWSICSSSVPSQIGDATVVVLSGELYFFGGWSDGIMLNTVKKYDPIKDIWTEKMNVMEEGISFEKAVVLDNKVYISGGRNSYGATRDTFTVYWLDRVCSLNTKIIDDNKELKPGISTEILHNTALHEHAVSITTWGNKSTPVPVPVKKLYFPDTNWRTSTPLLQGMDDKMLNLGYKFVKDELKGSLTSLLIVRNGYIVKEEYYNRTNKDTLYNIWSITKSFISGLVGIAIDKKFIKNEDEKIVGYFSEYLKENTDSLKAEITIKHLLTQTHGFKIEDYYGLQSSSDWFQYMLNSPMENKPGGVFNYSNGATHLLSGIITKATKKDTLQFAQEYLFNPLGISKYEWKTDPKGYYGGSHMLSLNTRDLAKYGYLYLNNGVWNDKQVISKEWVQKSTKSYISGCVHHEYGYLWWITRGRDPANSRDFYMYSARGSGGSGESSINVVPELNLVVVVTASGGDNMKIKELVTDYILPAVKSTN